MPGTKIATCCYCGTRAALVLGGRGRHELACSSCGAPLHEMKMLRADHAGGRDRDRPIASPAQAPGKDPRRRKVKPRKSLGRRILAKALDIVEEILD